ncbi:Membrane protein involved in the export of O-antigen and teichoic acid [Clostridium sp. DSM 8431]|uniref:hypothetical protein n=1 Tax=Clostridium sp. DSM 8431 TaxID=1761781 RepID=UPI0008E33F92|nr:hypothetical protein [Clostridium sp. DSM 8431]SFU65867.1 Membrane protein involved in the export of O-antigen and teichoic acid [Clostridium sp. DSM 8431]
MKKKNKLTQIIIYSISVYLGQFFKGLSSIILSGFLGPIGRGQYSYFNLYYQYLQYGSFGIRYATDKNLPLVYDDNNKERIKEFEVKSRTSLFIFQLIASILFIIYVSIFENNDLKILIIVTIISSLFYYINEFYKAIYRAEQKIMKISRYTILYYSFMGITQIIAIYFWKIQGAVYSLFLCNVLFYIFYFKKGRVNNIKLEFDYKFTKMLFKDGFILFINGITVFTIMSMDKFFIINFSSNRDFDLGLYTFATMFFGMFQILPNCIAEVLFPDLLIRIKNDTKEEVGKYLSESIKTLSKVFFVIISLSIIGYPLFVKIFMKDYINSINLFQIIIIGIYFIAIQSLCSYALVGIGKKQVVFFISFISLLVSIFINLLGIKIFGFGLIEIAAMSAITYMVYASIYLFVIYYHYKQEYGNFLCNLLFETVKLVVLVIINIINFFNMYMNLIYILDIIFVSILLYKKLRNNKKIQDNKIKVEAY